MKTYGTIPTSSYPTGTAVNLEYISRAKERLKAGLGSLRPWREMFELNCFDLPKSFSDAEARVRTNAAYFLMNYAIVVLLVLFLGLLYHPISLIVFVAMMAAWLFLYFLRDEPLVVFGRTISEGKVLLALAVVTIGVLMLTGATIDILSSVVIGVVAVLLHGGMRKTDDLSLDHEAAVGGLLRFSGGSSPLS